eukprot:19931-Heterococcus_DN1.PRE.2
MYSMVTPWQGALDCSTATTTDSCKQNGSKYYRIDTPYYQKECVIDWESVDIAHTPALIDL